MKNFPQPKKLAATCYAVSIPSDAANLSGDLCVPEYPYGIVIFAHGSGSSRNSPRNRQVAQTLQQDGAATLLMDLLTMDEEKEDLRTREYRFNIDLLAGRVVRACDWVVEDDSTAMLPVGCFGASTGAAAALVAAAERPQIISAVVSRGGRPDLAGEALNRVQSSTLLIVGGNDVPVINMNRAAQTRMRCETALEIIRGATHLFEEPGTLEQVADLARNWFRSHLKTRRRAA
jgi:putative phosphoribosyl transferase